jgi:hypothetical protein
MVQIIRSLAFFLAAASIASVVAAPVPGADHPPNSDKTVLVHKVVRPPRHDILDSPPPKAHPEFKKLVEQKK